MFAQMEQRLQEMHPKEEDRMFYYHSSEDRLVLSHALYWTMTQLQFFKGKIRKEKFFLLLRQYEEEMLDALLQEDDYFPELLHYCNTLYEMLPIILGASHLRAEKDASVRRIKDDIFQRQLDERERCFEKLKRDILK